MTRHPESPRVHYRRILEAVRRSGRVEPEDLPGVRPDEFIVLIRALVSLHLLGGNGAVAFVTERGLRYLAAFE